MVSKEDIDFSKRVSRAQLKVKYIYPGVVGEALADQLNVAWHLRTLLGPGSLSERLLEFVEEL